MKKIEAIISPKMLGRVIESLKSVSISDFVITEAAGFGNQKGRNLYYRGSIVEPGLLRKVKIEIFIGENLVNHIIELVIEAVKTGEAGDCKIFISEVFNEIEIETSDLKAESVSTILSKVINL
jgi:nitrogen regulatory protein P-II 1